MRPKCANVRVSSLRPPPKKDLDKKFIWLLVPVRTVKEWENETMEGVKPVKGECMREGPLWVSRAQAAGTLRNYVAHTLESSD